MSAIRWAAQTSGDFTVSADWVGGVVPSGVDVALVVAPGTVPYAVTSLSSTTVAALRVGPTATLDVHGGDFTIANQATSSVNSGTISVADTSALQLSGVLDNIGLVDLKGTAKGAEIRITAAGATFTGGGQIVLSDALRAPWQPCPPTLSIDEIDGTPGAILTNANNTIVGAGYIGHGQIAFVNLVRGIVDANLATDLVLDPIKLTNEGLVTSTGAGGLYLVDTTVENSGEISADGGIIYLSACEIEGGALVASGAGYYYSDHSSNVLNGELKPVSLKGYLFVSDGSTVTLEGAIENSGSIGVGNFGSQLLIGDEGATLTGGGVVGFDGLTGASSVTGASPGIRLDNVDDTLCGEGDIGDGALMLVNGPQGIISANAPGFVLTLDTGAATIVNKGIIQSTPSARLVVVSAIDNYGQLIVSDGEMTVAGAVNGIGDAEIAGGILEFESRFSQTVTFAGSSGQLILDDAREDRPTLDGFADTDSLDLRDIVYEATTSVTYTGSVSEGVLTVTDGTSVASVALNGDYQSDHFAVESDGQGGVLISLAGPVVAGPPTSVAWTSSIGGAFLDSTAWSGGKEPGAADIAVFRNLGGIPYLVSLTASWELAAVEVDPTATLGVAQGELSVDSVNSAGFNAGLIEVAGGAILALRGGLDNSGTVDLDGTAVGASFRVGAAGVSLTGGGLVLLAGVEDSITGCAGSVLANVDDTISGAGVIGSGQMTFENGTDGVVNADSAGALLLEPFSLSNAGLIEATGIGELNFNRTTVENSGSIDADGGVVTIMNSQIDGGSLASSNGGYFRIGLGAVILSGVGQPIDLDGDIDTSPSSALVLEGVIDNEDEINAVTHSFVAVGAPGATLTGGGEIILDGGKIAGPSAAPVLTNVNDTISGSGLIGAGSLSLVNEASGIIEVAGLGQTLSIDTGSASITNAGLIQSSGSAQLVIDSVIDNSGTLQVSGGMLEAEQVVSGLGEAMILGGTLKFGSGFKGSVTFAGAGGDLFLAKSQTDTVSITGFATGDSIDLADIAFSSADLISYSGGSTSGVLTVTEKGHTATITLDGDYLSASFILSADGSGGTDVEIPNAPSPALASIIQAAASLGGPSKQAPGMSSGHIDPKAPTADRILVRPWS